MSKLTKKQLSEFKTLKEKANCGDVDDLAKLLEFIVYNEMDQTDSIFEQYYKSFLQKLREENFDDAFKLAYQDCWFLDEGGYAEEHADMKRQLTDVLFKRYQTGDNSVINNLSACYCRDGKTDEAIALWQTLAENDNPAAQYALGRIYFNNVDDKKTAMNWFEKAQKNGYDLPEFYKEAIKNNTFGDCKEISTGVFWGIPEKFSGKQVIAGLGIVLNSTYYEGIKRGSVINSPFYHFEVFKRPRSAHKLALKQTLLKSKSACYEYPRLQLSYDTESEKHLITVDECIKQECIDELLSICEVSDYDIRHDETFVCANCKRKHLVPEIKYNILRGRDKIGANLIEITCGNTKLLVELGKELGGGEELTGIEKTVLENDYDAILISHYHEDHAGLIKRKKDSAIFMGEGACRIFEGMDKYNDTSSCKNFKTYKNGETFRIGHINITPFLCDHSAYDSYMLLFEAGGKSILYTGDFRFHGRKNKEKLLAALPKSVDVLIHEGTNIGKNSCTMTEAELENKAVEIMKSTGGPIFVLQSGTNIDRLVSIYRASKRSGRITYMDNYTSLIASAAGESIPRPDVFKDVIAFTPRAVHGKREEMFMEIINKRGLNAIANGTKRFTMLVRPSMLDYIKKLHSKADICGATLIYSMWKGYKETDYTAEFLKGMQELGVNIIGLHTSGHASAGDIELLKQTVNAKETVCVHTEV